MPSKKAVAISHTIKRQQKALMGDFVLEDVHLYRCNRHAFTIYVGGDPHVASFDDGFGPPPEPGVEHNMADRFCINLGILSDAEPGRPILIEVASCGGNWEEGMQMMGAIATCMNPVTVLATKWARSMTSIIPLAADRFLIRPPSQYMFHHGTYGFEGLVQEADTAHLELVKCREMMLDLYVDRLKARGKFSRWSDGRIRAMLAEKIEKHIDVWLSGDEAVEWGFVDDVYVGEPNALRATRKNERRRERVLNILRKTVHPQVVV